ncbi:MAG: ATP-binding protein [Opitutales bacterium]
MRIVGVYAGVAGVYILTSDAVLEAAVSDSNLLTQLQSFKGIGFVLVTALCLGIHLNRHLKERDALEDDLRRGRAYFSFLFERSPVSLVLLDRSDERIREVNPATEELMGAPSTDLVGSSVWDWIRPLDDGKDLERESLALGESTRSGLYERWTRDGDRQILSMHRTVDPDQPDNRQPVALLDLSDLIRNRANLQNAIHRLRRLSHRLETVREEEKKELAGQIHDDLGQWLVALRLDMNELAEAQPDNPKVREALMTLERVIERSRNLTQHIRPFILEEDGNLPEGLQWLAENLEQDYDMAIDVEIAPGWEPVPAEAGLMLFRFVQEALTNVRKHAGVTAALVRLEPDGDGFWILDVEDAGRGISTAWQENRSMRSFGLFNMEERAEAVHGKFEISDREGGGTRARLRFDPAKCREVSGDD